MTDRRMIEDIDGPRLEEEWEVAERDMAAKLAEAQDEWHRRWPNACKACKGWGLFVFYQSHGRGMSEQMTDPCDALPENTCHRCGALNATNDETGSPCLVCGWAWDDGEPS